MRNQNLTIFVFGIFGAIAFFLLHQLTNWLFDKNHVQIWSIAIFYAVAGLSATTLIFYNQITSRKLAITLASIFVLSFVLSYSLANRYAITNTSEQLFGDLALLTLGFACLMPFIANYWKNGKSLDYATLYDTAWFIFVGGVISFLFACLSLGILFLLLKTLISVGLNFLEELYEHDGFFVTYFGLSLGLAIGISHIQSQIITVLRKILAMLLMVLLPLVFITVTLIAIRLPFAPPEFTASLGAMFIMDSTSFVLMLIIALSAAILTALADRHLFFGKVEKTKFNDILNIMARIVCIALIALGAFMLWGIYARIHAYGFTPARIIASIFAIIAAIYAFGYGIASLIPKGDWAKRIESVNIAAALLLIAFCLLSATPIFNIERLSANSQYKRFEAGTPVMEVGITEMRFSWGKAGQATFDKIIAQTDDPRVAKIEKDYPELFETNAEIEAFNDAAEDAREQARLEKLNTNITILNAPQNNGADHNLINRNRNESFRLRTFLTEACIEKEPSSICVGIIGDFLALSQGEELLVFTQDWSDNDEINAVILPQFSDAPEFDMNQITSVTFTFEPPSEADEIVKAIRNGDVTYQNSPPALLVNDQPLYTHIVDFPEY